MPKEEEKEEGLGGLGFTGFIRLIGFIGFIGFRVYGNEERLGARELKLTYPYMATV